MSFESLKKDELLAAAEQFGVEADSSQNKAEIIAALAEDGVTWETYREFNQVEDDNAKAAVAEEPQAEEAGEEDGEDEVLIKMTRRNRTFQALGYTFKADAPFALVKESDANVLVEDIGGFQIATPKEAKEFYS